MNPWVALRPGDDVARRARQVRSAHRSFVDHADAVDVRAVVRESWIRSVRSGVDPDAGADGHDLSSVDLREYRRTHPMAAVRPVVRRLLLDDMADTGLVVAITDAVGRLLWVEGDAVAKDRAAAMNFAEGADWSERQMGTNAPGTALAVDHSVQIFATEHFSRVAHDWSCSAAPVHDPATGAVLGAIDITGGPRVAAPEMLSLVRATVAAVEAQLLVRAPRALADGDHAALSVLGQPELIRDGRRIMLSRRHAEILVLLAEYREGLSGERLAVLLDEAELDAVTVRAEVSRLRRVLGADVIESRPYRLGLTLRTDVDEVRAALEADDLATALARYRGALLPDSTAPGIAALRDELLVAMRAGLLRSGDPALLRQWLHSSDGRDDRDCWLAYRAGLGLDHPQYAQANARIALIDERLGG